MKLFRKKKKYPTKPEEMLDSIEKTIVPIMTKYGITRAWIYGDYYEGVADWFSDVDIMVMPEEVVGQQLAFMGDCWDALNFRLYATTYKKGDKRSEYILNHSRLVHAP